MDYVLAFDVGTSTLKGILVNKDGEIQVKATANYQVNFVKEGYVEEDPADWWNGVVKATHEIMSKTSISPSEIKGMVFSTQALNVVPVGEDGSILRNAISWMDSRAEEEAKEIVEMIGGVEVCESLMGTVFSGMDLLPKVRWIMKNEPQIFEKMSCFLDCNGYLTYRATGEKVYDIASASFLGYDRESGSVIADLIGTSGFDPAKFPRLVKSFEKVGNLTPAAAKELGLTTNTAVFGGTDDIQSAALGSGMVGLDEAHLYLGTSGWAAVGTDRIATLTNGGGCIMSADPNMQLWVYSTETCCATLNWFIDNFYAEEKKTLGCEKLYELIAEIIASIPVGSNNLIFNPWLSGERSPIQDVYVRGGFLNIGMAHTKNHMLRALMESVAYNLKWCYDSLENDLGKKADVVRILGGGTNNKVWMQIFADVFNRKIEVLHDSQMAGAIGSGFLAALGLGLYKKMADIKEWARVEHTYKPIPENVAIYEKAFINFKESYSYLKDFYQKINKE